MSRAAEADRYFEMYGLTARPPEELNQALVDAIGKLHRTLYGTSLEELTVNEIALYRRAGVDLEEHPDRPDPMLQYTTEFAAILATSFTPAEAAARLGGVTPVRVRQMIHARTLFAIQVGGRWHVPTFQITEAGLVPNIGMVNEALPETLDPVSVVRWYTWPDPQLELTEGTAASPLEWLKRGLDPAVLVPIASNL